MVGRPGYSNDRNSDVANAGYTVGVMCQVGMYAAGSSLLPVYYPSGGPSKYRSDFSDVYEPEGLKEPILDSISEAINDLGLNHWKPYRFYNSDPSVITDRAAGANKFETDARNFGVARGLWNSFYVEPIATSTTLIPGAFLDKVTIDGKDADKITNRHNNLTVSILDEPGGDSARSSEKLRGRTYKPDITYRFTGSIYIPSANNHIDAIGIFLTDGTGDGNQVFVSGITGGTTNFSFNQWNDFDFEFLNENLSPDDTARRLRMFAHDSSAISSSDPNDYFEVGGQRVGYPGANASGDFFAFNNFTVLEKTSANRVSNVTTQAGFQPHMMYDPVDGQGYQAQTYASHLSMQGLGYTHARQSKNNFAYMAFSADDFFGVENFKKDYQLSCAISGENFEVTDENIFKFSFPEVTGFDLSVVDARESFVGEITMALQTQFQGGVYDGQYICNILNYGSINDYKYPFVTGSSNTLSLGSSLEESESNKFKGAFLYPIYLGKDEIPLASDGSVDTGLVFIDPSDSSTISGNKISSGISNNYDVFALKNGNFEYAHVANPDINAPSSEIVGKKIELKLSEKDPTLFNFTNFNINYNLGEEVQTPLTQESVTSIEFNKPIFGPSNPNETFNDEINMDGDIDNYNDFGMRRYSAIDGTSSADVEPDGTRQSDWMDNIPLDFDRTDVVHLVDRRSVSCIKATFIIEGLSQDIVRESEPVGATVKRDSIDINFSIITSFEGVPESIYAPQETKISYFGQTSTFYAVDTEEITLPSYDDIIDDYPGQDRESLAKKFKRKVVIRKNDFETNSVRINRSARLYQILEVIKESFSYPFSAIMKTKVDARTFSEPPNKQYQLRLRKIKIPSNYFPLDLSGRDKRFVEDAANLGTRIIYDGDWDGTFKIGWTDNPAWILYDLLINQRYGIGNRLDDIEDINIFNLYKIGRYCDSVDNNGNFVGLDDGLGGLEPRFSCNIMLDAGNNAFESVKEIASVFNGMAFWSNGTLDFFADQPKEVMMYFNNGNVFDGIFNYQTTSKSSLFNIADVNYVDKRDEFLAKRETIVDEDGMRQNGILRRGLSARGATSRSQATRLARYVLYSNKLEREIVNFKTASQGLMLSIGDIIEVQDELKNFEANYAKILNIQSVGDKFIEIENKINTNSVINNHSGAFVIASTGQDKLVDLYNEIYAGGTIGTQEMDDMYTPQVQKLKITGVTDLNTKIRVGVEDPDGYLTNAQTGTLINLDLQNRTAQQYRVLTVNPEEGNLYGITATEYKKEKFDLIESPLDFKLDDSDPFNVGIPNNKIKTISEHAGFSYQVVNNNYEQQIDFAISGDITGNETVYNINVIYPNGKVDTKRIEKQSTVENGFFKTTGTFNDVSSFGNYIFEIESVRSEEIIGGTS